MQRDRHSFKRSKLKFLIVDDHIIVAKGLTAVLQESFKSAVVEDVNDLDTAFERLEKGDFNFLILDMNISGVNSFSFFELVKLRFPNLLILIFSMYPESIFARRYLGLGANGYLMKTAADTQIIEAIHEVLGKNIFMSRDLKDRLAESQILGDPVNLLDKLSNREMEIMLMLIKGQGLKHISEKLSIKNNTVATYKFRIFEKLNVNNIIDLQNMARMNGLE